MKYSKKLYDYEIKGYEQENNLINEKINDTTKNYFYLVNNFSKEITHIEKELNLLRPYNQIKINELIYNQHNIIKELISIINNSKKGIVLQNNSKDEIKIEEKNEFSNNSIENNIISFSILSSNLNSDNSIRIIKPLPTSYTNNNSLSRNDVFKSIDKKNMNSLSTLDDNDYSLRIKNRFKYNENTPIIQKIKRNYNNISKEVLSNVKLKLKYKCYKPSFLNSFVSAKKIKNKKHKDNEKNSVSSRNKIYSYIDRKLKQTTKDKRISNFNGTFSCDSKNSGIKNVKNSFSNRNQNMNNSFYNISIIDNSFVNDFLDRTNSKTKANKYVKKLYFISNEIVDKYQKKISDN